MAALGEVGGRAAVEALTRVIKENVRQSNGVRIAAAKALKRILPPEQAAVILLQFVTDGAATSTRTATIWPLASLNYSRSICGSR